MVDKYVYLMYEPFDANLLCYVSIHLGALNTIFRYLFIYTVDPIKCDAWGPRPDIKI